MYASREFGLHVKSKHELRCMSQLHGGIVTTLGRTSLKVERPRLDKIMQTKISAFFVRVAVESRVLQCCSGVQFFSSTILPVLSNIEGASFAQ